MFVKDKSSGKIVPKLVKLGWPIARIPTIAPHFGIRAEGQANRETRMVPIIGLDNSDLNGSAGTKEETAGTSSNGAAVGSFVDTQPQRLVEVIAKEIGVTDRESSPLI